MNFKLVNWVIFIVLSFIWGSSFILMKEGLLHLSAYQVASIRILSSGLVLWPFAVRTLRKVRRKQLFILFLSGAFGNLVPAYLFCVAEERVDSALAGTLNSLTPIFVIIVGGVLFRSKTSTLKIAGIILSFTGSILLLLSKGFIGQDLHLFYVSLIVVATIFYGINVNMVRQKLAGFGSLEIASVSLSLNAIPALVVLYLTGFFHLPLGDKGVLISTAWSAVLGIFGTAVASVLFYMLVKRTGVVFSSMVTYGIPVVANGWGIIYGEEVGWKQFACLMVILAGVFVANIDSKKADLNDITLYQEESAGTVEAL